jgi:tetratricopeptide (TPR) repeat protein
MEVVRDADRTPGLLDEARKLHRAGALAEAQAAYERVLAGDGRHWQALAGLGTIRLQLGAFEEGARFLQRSLDLNPEQPLTHYNRGIALQTLGRLSESVASYECVLANEPQHAEALCNRGLALHDLGRLDEALPSYDRAIAVNPQLAEAHFNRGRLLRAIGRAEEALASFDHALAIRPDHAEAWCERGNALFYLRRPEQALTSYDRALALDPDYVEAHNNRGDALKELTRHDEALASYQRAIALAPDFARLHGNLGNALKAAGRLQDALASYDRALRIDPDLADVHYNRGNALHALDRPAEALAAYERAVALRPDLAPAQVNRGNVLNRLDRFEEALACFDRAIALQPERAEAHVGRGKALGYAGRVAEALASYDRAIDLQPERAEARSNKALLLLATGRYAEGWALYEHRLRFGETAPAEELPVAQWDGEPLHDKRLLVRDEQGLGDGIMFASCLPDAIARAGACVVVCRPKLRGLFERSFPAATVIDESVPWAALRERVGAPDFQVRLGSLPLRFRGAREAFPGVPYLQADPRRVQAWRARLAALGPGLKVGISWRGGVATTRTRARTIPLGDWPALRRAEGCHLVSLQYGPVEDDLASARDHGLAPLHHWPEAIEDYEETAALVTALDLVVSVQTAVVHLSGALGRRAWALIPRAPEWRYGLEGAGMPWYRSVRLFRQADDGDWAPVLDTVARELAALAGERR